MEILYQDKEEPRLGESFSRSGTISPVAKERGIKSLERLLNKAKSFNPSEIRGVGTRILRDAQNAGEFIRDVRQKLGVEIEVISGEKEARYAFIGALYGIDADNFSTLVVDIGGGSTELSFRDANGRIQFYSLSFGAVIITENFLNAVPADENEYAQARELIIKQLNENFPDELSYLHNVVFSGGTATTAAAAILKLDNYDYIKVHGHKFSFADMAHFDETIRRANVEQRKEILKLNPQRADIIAGGLLIMLTVAKYFRFDDITISDTGIRFGVLLEMFS